MGKTFKEFKESRKYVTDLSRVFPDNGLEGVDGYIYLDSYYIEEIRPGKTYQLIIGIEETTSDDLNFLEQKLWDDFARDEQE